MPLLQSPGPVQRFPHTRVFTQEGLAVVFYPIQHLGTNAHTAILNTQTHN